MKLKRVLYIIVIILLSLHESYAESPNTDQFALKTNANSISLGGLQITDMYLSPLTYKGQSLKLQNNSRQLINPTNDKLSLSQWTSIDIGSLISSAQNNRMYSLLIDYAIGLSYHIRPMDRMMLMVGGNIDFEFGANYLARNINNPASAIANSNLNLTSELQYLLFIRNQKIRLQYGIMAPFIGMMFVPRQNSSYYEIFGLNNWSGAIHASSFHNKQSFNHYFHADYPFKYSTLRFSLQHQHLAYRANDMVFTRKSIHASLGYVFFIQNFKTKEQFPKNFKHAYE